jgi:hypothetical protein
LQILSPEELIIKAKAFNKLIYNKAKHDWNIHEEEHSFYADDAVMVYFAARKLAKRFLAMRSSINVRA